MTTDEFLRWVDKIHEATTMVKSKINIIKDIHSSIQNNSIDKEIIKKNKNLSVLTEQEEQQILFLSDTFFNSEVIN